MKRWLFILCACLVSSMLDAGNSGSLTPGGEAAPYLVYAAFLTQSGTDAPVAAVLQNTLGVAVEWTREATGNYTANAAGTPFTAGKTFLITSPDPSKAVAHLLQPDLDGATETVIPVIAFDSLNHVADDLIHKDFVEIRVYL